MRYGYPRGNKIYPLRATGYGRLVVKFDTGKERTIHINDCYNEGNETNHEKQVIDSAIESLMTAQEKTIQIVKRRL